MKNEVYKSSPFNINYKDIIMTTPQVQNDPIYSLPFLYKNGLILSNDVTTPNTILNVSAGQCRDSNDIIDMGIGIVNPNIQGSYTVAPLSIDASINGLNGLDTGTFSASTVYAVYIIGDSRYYQPTGAILTIDGNSPLLPFGYDSSRLIGYWATDSSAHFYIGYYAGNASTLVFNYDSPPLVLNAGANTSYTSVSLGAWIAAVNNSIVCMQSDFSANTAGNALRMRGLNSTGDAIVITAPVIGSTAHVTTESTLLAQLSVSNVPEIQYRVTNSADRAILYVSSFEVFI